MEFFDKIWFDIRSFEKCAFGGEKNVVHPTNGFSSNFLCLPWHPDGRNPLNLLAELFADRVHHVMAS